MIQGILIYFAGCITGVLFMSLFVASGRKDGE